VAERPVHGRFIPAGRRGASSPVAFELSRTLIGGLLRDDAEPAQTFVGFVAGRHMEGDGGAARIGVNAALFSLGLDGESIPQHALTI